MQDGFGVRGQRQGRRQHRQPRAQRRGGCTQLHRDENSKCGWVAREQLLWEQAEEEFSHLEGASWGKIQEFSAAVEGRQAGWGDGDRLGTVAPTTQARDACAALPALPGPQHPGVEVLGSPMRCGICHMGSVALQAGTVCGQPMAQP